MLYSNLVFPDVFQENNIIVSLEISNDGIEFTNKALETIVTFLDEDYCKGLLIKGDSLNIVNRYIIRDILRTIRAIYGNSKIIMLDTGYSLNEAAHIKDIAVDEIVRYSDSI